MIIDLMTTAPLVRAEARVVSWPSMVAAPLLGWAVVMLDGISSGPRSADMRNMMAVVFNFTVACAGLCGAVAGVITGCGFRLLGCPLSQRA